MDFQAAFWPTGDDVSIIVPLKPEISVVVCTRNRSAQLGELLASLSRLRIPTGLKWEVCIVDNGSSDNTSEVVERYQKRIPVRLVREEMAGLSNARNRGVQEARGRYICWTDDDVELDPEWLAAYASAFETYPDAAIFGGRILPRLEAPTPPWFARLAGRWPLTTLLAARDFGDAPFPLGFDVDRIPWGANFAVRVKEQRACSYDPRLGVSPAQRRLGEEAEVIFRVMQAGATGWWVPGAIVHHIIPLRRQSRQYVVEYFTSSGETLAYLEAAYPAGHHMRASAGARSVAAESEVMLQARRSAAMIGYAACWLARADLRGLYFLRQVAFFGGILAYRRRIET